VWVFGFGASLIVFSVGVIFFCFCFVGFALEGCGVFLVQAFWFLLFLCLVFSFYSHCTPCTLLKFNKFCCFKNKIK
jgi:hypothetical protein